MNPGLRPSSWVDNIIAIIKDAARSLVHVILTGSAQRIKKSPMTMNKVHGL